MPAGVARADSRAALWEARLGALEQRFGPAAERVLHAPVPFEFGLAAGGGPDLLRFPGAMEETLYVSASLIGSAQVPNARGSYELAIAHHGNDRRGLGLLRQLAYHTLHTPLEDGQTMEVGSGLPRGATVRGVLFRRIAEFDVFGLPANVICCIGITAPELRHCRRHGPRALIARLGRDYLATALFRNSRL